MSHLAGLTLKPATRRTLADSITESLRDAIFDGVFKPGQRLAEAQLATSLKVSRAPVREALVYLEQEGLVSRTPSGGTTVAHLSLGDIEEICTLRESLELLAVRLAATRGSQADWARLADNIRATEKVGDPEQLAQMDLEFHELIVRAAGHSRLLSSWLNLRSQIRLIMVQRNLSDTGTRRGTVQGHKEVLQALQSGDGASAAGVLEYHLKNQVIWFVHSSTEAK